MYCPRFVEFKTGGLRFKVREEMFKWDLVGRFFHADWWIYVVTRGRRGFHYSLKYI